MIERGQTWVLVVGEQELVYLILKVDPGESRNAVIKVLDLTTGHVNTFWKDSFTALSRVNGEKCA